MIKVFMTPSPSRVQGTCGIDRVCLAYNKHMPKYGFEYVDTPQECDLIANHAGSGQVIDGFPFVCHTHGLHWTADYPDASGWQYKANAGVIASIRKADEVTVPSAWVAETFQRDMRFTPHIIGHGIDWQEWDHNNKHENYVLWNKNRTGDVCFIEPVKELAVRFRQVLFASTYVPTAATPNIKELGVLPHSEMKGWVQKAMVYLSTTKETFGIGILEALASGVPVLGFDFGGNSEIVQHGVCGYLAEPNNYDDLEAGLAYCIQHRDTLSQNAIEIAKQFTWESVCEQVAKVYNLALEPKYATASIVIPVYNKQEYEIKRAVESAIAQSYEGLENIVVVDDGSDNEDIVRNIVEEYQKKENRLKFIRQNNQGVACARNNGIAETTSKYICCLDADDEIHPDMLQKIVPYLEGDKALGIAYSGLAARLSDGKIKRQTRWPHECQFGQQLKGKNQVPTCCVFRRTAWERCGGYKQRYAPVGCGAEDAELWLRMGAYGWGIAQVTKAPLFIYTIGGTTMQPGYTEVNWTYWHPWTKDARHPFASIAHPERLSHPVRQYDMPEASVIIPVGPGHEKDLYNALDSLEAQTFRNWEAIIINDSGEVLELSAYPYVKMIETEGKQGAGYSRNRGVEIARAPFVVFLDADDWLYPKYLERCVETWNTNKAIVYTDYVGKAIISDELAQNLQRSERLKSYNSNNGEAVIAHRSADYDCELAQQQPRPTGDKNMPFYHWSLVTCFVPKTWHNEIGGFDEKMPTWEDIDYHWRMAREDKCYVRVPEELVVYNFHTGHRREKSHKMFGEVIEYIKEKYEREQKQMANCSSCKGKVNTPNPGAFGMFSQYESQMAKDTRLEKDDNYVWCKYIGHPNNRSDHPIVGHVTQERYGYGRFGVRVLVNRQDVFDVQGRHVGPFEVIPEKPKAQPKIQQTPKSKKVIEAPAPITKPKEVSAPQLIGEPKEEPIDDSFSDLKDLAINKDLVTSEKVDLQTIPGITKVIERQLRERQVETVDALLDFGIEGLAALKYCDEGKAELIVSAIEERYL